MRIKYIIAIIILFVYNNTIISQCMEVDISINRTCTEGQGTITILTGDIDSVTYSIDGGTTFTNNPTFQNLNIGVYNIVVKDTTGCTLNFTEEIEQFLQVGTITTSPSCANNTGQIIAKGYLGKPLYQYSFDGGQSFYTDSSKSDIAAGTYQVVIKDSYGCEIDTAITVDAYPTISPILEVSNEQCNGSGPGSVEITFTDGANYDFSLNNGALTNGISYVNNNLTSGYYVVDITDQNGCTSPFQFQVGADLVDDSVNINHEYCRYGNGQIEVFGFLGVSPYEYSIDNGVTYSTSGVFENLSQGHHVVYIKDSIGCIKQDSIYVTNFGEVTAIPSLDDTVCIGNSAIISVVHNVGTSATYNWNNGLTGIQSHTVTPSVTTTYSVVVTDVFGCKDTAETTIYVETIPDVSLNTNQLQACVGETIQLNAYGAAEYTWSTGDTSSTLNHTAVGNETITVTGYNGQCYDSEQALIIIKPSPTAVASSNTTSINTGDSIFFSNLGSTTSTSNWNFGDGYTSQESNPHHRFDFPGAYYVVLTAEMGGCESKDTLLVYVGTVSIKEEELENILVYPNPTTEKINIKINKSYNFKLIDSKGVVLMEEELKNKENIIKLENIPQGMYFIKLTSKNNQKTIKLVKKE